MNDAWVCVCCTRNQDNLYVTYYVNQKVLFLFISTAYTLHGLSLYVSCHDDVAAAIAYAHVP